MKTMQLKCHFKFAWGFNAMLNSMLNIVGNHKMRHVLPQAMPWEATLICMAHKIGCHTPLDV